MFGHSRRGPAGYIQIAAPGKPVIERETMQCAHCGKHWITEPGSGTKRGWCMKCNQVTCGARACDVCVPYEAQLEIMEGATERTARRYLVDFEQVILRTER